MRLPDEEATNVKRTIERLYDEKDALRSQNQALQERAEKAEAALGEIRAYAVNRPRLGYDADDTLDSIDDLARNALSPTQETEWGNTRQILTRPTPSTHTEESG